MSEQFFVALKDFAAPYDGRIITVSAGITRVAPGHELVRDFPDHWKVEQMPSLKERIAERERALLELIERSSHSSRGDFGGRVDAAALESSESSIDEDAPRVLDGDADEDAKRRDAWLQWLEQAAASASAVAPYTTPSRSRDVELRASVTPRVIVQLMPAARRDLDRESRVSRPRLIAPGRALFERGDYELGVEAAAYLYGRFTPNGAVVDVVTGTGTNATPTSVTFEAGDKPARAFESELREVFDALDTRLIGDAHTHPNGGHDGRPSDGDLRAWGAEIERIEAERGTSQYLGLVGITEGGDGGLFRVQWHAWVVERTAFGRLVCEAAYLEERA
jgi:hypothetical protein